MPLTLPDELLIHVASQLRSPRDVGSFATSCLALHSLLSLHADRLWRALALKNFPYLEELWTAAGATPECYKSLFHDHRQAEAMPVLPQAPPVVTCALADFSFTVGLQLSGDATPRATRSITLQELDQQDDPSGNKMFDEESEWFSEMLAEAERAPFELSEYHSCERHELVRCQSRLCDLQLSVCVTWRGRTARIYDGVVDTYMRAKSDVHHVEGDDIKYPTALSFTFGFLPSSRLHRPRIIHEQVVLPDTSHNGELEMQPLLREDGDIALWFLQLISGYATEANPAALLWHFEHDLPWDVCHQRQNEVVSLPSQPPTTPTCTLSDFTFTVSFEMPGGVKRRRSFKVPTDTQRTRDVGDRFAAGNFDVRLWNAAPEWLEGSVAGLLSTYDEDEIWLGEPGTQGLRELRLAVLITWNGRSMRLYEGCAFALHRTAGVHPPEPDPWIEFDAMCTPISMQFFHAQPESDANRFDRARDTNPDLVFRVEDEDGLLSMTPALNLDGSFVLNFETADGSQSLCLAPQALYLWYFEHALPWPAGA